MLIQCWSTVYDAGPTVDQHRAKYCAYWVTQRKANITWRWLNAGLTFNVTRLTAVVRVISVLMTSDTYGRLFTAIKTHVFHLPDLWISRISIPRIVCGATYTALFCFGFRYTLMYCTFSYCRQIKIHLYRSYKSQHSSEWHLSAFHISLCPTMFKSAPALANLGLTRQV